MSCSGASSSSKVVDFPAVQFPQQFTSGYGEFIAYFPDSKIPSLNENEFSKIYRVFSFYSPGELMGKFTNTEIREIYENRFSLISEEVKKLNCNLKIAFTPKTLYELVLIRKTIQEDLKNQKSCHRLKANDYYFKIQSINEEIKDLIRQREEASNSYQHIEDNEKRDRYILEDVLKVDKRLVKENEEILALQKKEERLQSKKCWHHIAIRNGNRENNNDPIVEKIAYLMNHTLGKLFLAAEEKREETPFTGSIISKLVEDELQFFQRYALKGCEEHANNVPCPSFIKELKSPTRLFRYPSELPNRTYGNSLAIYGENSQIIRKTIQLECSELATSSILLFRASKFEKDSVLHFEKIGEGTSLSFGTSLFAGAMYDIGAMVWNLLRGRNGYAIYVPIEQVNISGMYFPPSNTTCQLFGRGEIFHARTMVPVGQKQVHGIDPLGRLNGLCSIEHLYTTMSLPEIAEAFDNLRKEAINILS